MNQYTQRTVPGDVDVIGIGFATNAVLVNGQVAYPKGEYFRQQLAVNNSSTALWTNITVSATNQTGISGNQFVAKTPETFGYDADGNLTNDGRWIFTWDAENRLVQLVTNTPAGPQQLIKFEYDSRGRRIHKQVWPNTTGSGNPTNDVKFIYDGWNLVAQLSTNNSMLFGWMWGADLSGSPQGAGGVGGLLEVVYYGATATNAFAAFDGNGNVGGLGNAADGTTIAQYEYGPFGEVIRMTGPMARANLLRFSTKYQDDESDLLYYGYRYYNPSTGRWLVLDPYREQGFEVGIGGSPAKVGPINLAGERGNPHLFCFLRNAAVNDIDPLGLCCVCGKDVTTAVFQTLQDIADTYANASWFRRMNARNSMFGVLSFSSWDIIYLYHYVNPYPAVAGCEDCDYTVTFQRMCVRPNELNYIMYGWGTQVTGFPRGLAIELLTDGLLARRPIKGESIWSIARKVEFAKYGSDFSRKLPSWVASSPGCESNKERLNVDIHDWQWMGLKWGGGGW